MSWYPDDKTWLKVRKAQWKEVKESLKEMRFYTPQDVKLIKEYFLYGPDKEPLRTVNNYGEVRCKVLHVGMITVWLHPSFERSYIVEELDKYEAGTRNSNDRVKDYYNGGERLLQLCDLDYETHKSATDDGDTSFFQGKEQLLAELLLPASVEDESWFKNSLRDEDRLKAKCERSFRMAINRLSSYFSKHMENPNPNFIYRYRLSYCISALKHFKGSEFEAQPLKENLVTFFAAIDKFTASPDKYPQCFVETAQEFTRLFNEADLPDSVHALLAPYIKAAKEGAA
ncbi:hypothetical protein [Pseudoalteromonas ruthenica]|uniref:Uncharacterized protein n=1 Tax=Pseudoalteromonas ruthenica TaxID=151081 RepID=A0A0F4PJX9_9GAMM|nr:hypothetical protein [Pseudoalteromonas ruthenica]KJY94526.1 hypothetical protein TW72_18695 [Pseudoalteromonas ruthenica]KJY94530.1 hypothetical protein TW76_18105 [Pseudoalteromonas ruthenica]TMO90649.1 hypothetical protein CWC13_18730 [Pseudoalteromonas ruthenica]TMO95843.1 hypothetical protein CWC07_18880 [Pseudoalteromonas ruthenica]TMP03235.1 hypothetical protein CWC09_18570 [Pseudoalteromonas ruthenica]